jgi:Domain of unknown function (DUF4864)
MMDGGYNTQMDLSDRDRRAIRSIVEAQLQALQHNDGDLAFAHASPGIQAMFRNPDNFMRMVRQSYQPVCCPRAVIFEDIRLLQDSWTQPVLLLSPEGNPLRALYLMEQQPTRCWKINGCYLVPIELPYP